MADNSPEMNARRLKAWNAWKEVCWVHGLGKPRGDLPIVGTEEDEKLLSGMIENAFRRKLAPYMEQLEDSQGLFAFSGVDFAQEFDAALCEYEHVDIPDRRFHDDMPKPRAKKAWKDDIWLAISTSKDPPLKVIIGKLLGVKGVVDRVVTEWLLSNFSVRIKGDMLEFIHSRDADKGEKKGVLDQDGGNPLESEGIKVVSPGSCDMPGDAEDEPHDDATNVSSLEIPEQKLNVWRNELGKAFSTRLCCLMLAHINGVKLYADKEILAALGISKATAAGDIGKNKKGKLNAAQKALSLLNPELRDWILCDDAGTRFFRKWIEDQCRLENAGQLILSRIEEKSKDGQ